MAKSSSDVTPWAKPLCAFCGERVYITKAGMWMRYPEPVSLHHRCVAKWFREQKAVT